MGVLALVLLPLFVCGKERGQNWDRGKRERERERKLCIVKYAMNECSRRRQGRDLIN